MRLTLLLFTCFGLHLVAAQSPKAPNAVKKYCQPIEVVVQAAINSFKEEKRELIKTYEVDYDMGGMFNIEEYRTIFYWPGTSENFIQVSTAAIEDEQTISFVSRMPKVDTKAKAYAHLQNLYQEITLCTIMPIPGQPARTKNRLLPVSKTFGGTYVLDTVFTLNGVKRRVGILLALNEENKKFFAELRVRLILADEEVIVQKCDALSAEMKQLATGFVGKWGAVVDSKDLAIGNGVSIKTVTYKALDKWPGSNGAWIENSQTKKNGTTQIDRWKKLIWFSSYSYENALSKYKKLYNQLLGCTVTTPTGRQVQLTSSYAEPTNTSSGNKRGLIEFKTGTTTDNTYITITLEKDNESYFVWLTITK